jgi:glycosyltransferase involved in cell wall biosynthesis
MGGELPRLVVFADDWGRHPSSAQHLVRELLPRWQVDCINTVGTRRPSLTLSDAKKIATKLASWLKPAERGTPDTESLPANLIVHSPAHWPGFGAGWERAVNARLLDRALRPLIERAEAVVATAPIVADLAARIPEANWIYYCVDDLAEWPGLDAEALRALEKDFVPRAKRIVVVSEHLRGRIRSMGRESELVTHGFDPAHWAQVATLRAELARCAHAPARPGPAAHSPAPTATSSDSLRATSATPAGPSVSRPPDGNSPAPDFALERDKPIVVFWGAIDARLDVPIVLALAERCDLRLVGPLADPDQRILTDPRIARTGPVPYADLPRIAAEADLLVMPYADLPVTRAMQPLKLKEYLATGLPVVATSLPANLEWSDAADLVDTPAAFTTRVLERAAAALPPAQVRARERLAGETWTAKARQFEASLRRSAPSR